MAGLSTLSMIAGLIGTGISAAGTIAAGNAEQTAAEFEAKQIEAAGKEELAASQREAAKVRKERDFILSRQQAVSGASGLGALDETVLDLAGDVTQEAAVNEKMALYGGKERAAGRSAQAAGRRMSGAAAKKGSVFSAAGTIMGGMGSFASDWNKRPASTSSYSSRYAS